MCLLPAGAVRDSGWKRVMMRRHVLGSEEEHLPVQVGGVVVCAFPCSIAG